MKTLLLITLAACAVHAVPVRDADSEVDLVQPRRVITSSRAGPSYAGASAVSRPFIDVNELMRRVLSSGFRPVARPRVDPNCDRGNFQLDDEEYEMVMTCQRERSEEQDLKQCILEGLPEESSDLRTFLDRDEYTIAGISFSVSFVIVNGESAQKRSITLRLCPPSDETNTVEEEEEEEEEEERRTQEAQPPATRPFFPFRDFTFGSRPTLQVPDVFSQPDSFFDFDAFKPIFNFKPIQVPSLPGFDIDIAGFPPADYDPEICVRQTFQLPKEQFDKAKNCYLGADNFKECMAEQLGEDEEAKEMLEFIGADGMVVVGRRFFSSLSNVNGVITQKNKIQLTHCEEAEEPEDRAEPQEPAGEVEQEIPQEQEAAPEQTPEQPSQQETYAGDDFEP